MFEIIIIIVIIIGGGGGGGGVGILKMIPYYLRAVWGFHGVLLCRGFPGCRDMRQV
jgi:hypothetical protein